MIIHYDRQKLGSRIKDIFELCGISISILDVERKMVVNCSVQADYCSLLQSIPNEAGRCRQCDAKLLDRCRQTGKLESHICRAGLCDAAMPIIKYDQLVGYVLMGRVRSSDSPSTAGYQPKAAHGQLDTLNVLYQNLPVLTPKQLAALYQLLPAILFNDAISIIYDPFMTQVLEYIHTHLQQKITVGSLCEKFHVSTNYLYEAFRKNMDCTVNDYVIDQRIRQAQAFLIDSNEPVYAIAEKVGIDNDTYFCRLFKKRIGLTPTQYRKKQHIGNAEGVKPFLTEKH